MPTECRTGEFNLQGAVSEHFDMTRKAVENLKLDIEVEEVRYSGDVEKCDGLIISGEKYCNRQAH